MCAGNMPTGKPTKGARAAGSKVLQKLSQCKSKNQKLDNGDETADQEPQRSTKEPPIGPGPLRRQSTTTKPAGTPKEGGPLMLDNLGEKQPPACPGTPVILMNEPELFAHDEIPNPNPGKIPATRNRQVAEKENIEDEDAVKPLVGIIEDIPSTG